MFFGNESDLREIKQPKCALVMYPLIDIFNLQILTFPGRPGFERKKLCGGLQQCCFSEAIEFNVTLYISPGRIKRSSYIFCSFGNQMILSSLGVYLLTDVCFTVVSYGGGGRLKERSFLTAEPFWNSEYFLSC